MNDLTKQVEVLKSEIQVTKETLKQVESEKVNQLSRMMMDYFEEVLEKGDTIKVSS